MADGGALDGLIIKVADKMQLNKYRYAIGTEVNQNDGFLSNLVQVDLDGESEMGKEALKLLIKLAPKGKNVRRKVAIRLAFQKEIFFYEVVFPTLDTIQQEIPIKFDNIPTCYATSFQEFSEALVFSNLKASGYEMWDYREPMNQEHLSMVLKTYGKLHALSLAYKKKNPEGFAKITQNSKTLLFCLEDTDLPKMVQKQCEIAGNSLDPIKDHHALEAFKKFVDNLLEFLRNIRLEDDTYSIFAHGDCWCNNMLFAYDTKEKIRPRDVKLIDFQLSWLSPPVLEFFHFFYCNASEETMRNIDSFKQIYYSSLVEQLKLLGCDPKESFPEEAFNEQYRKYHRHGLMFCCMILYARLHKDNMKSPEEIEFSDDNFFGHANLENIDLSVFYRRIRRIILYFVAQKII